jgi:adenosylcobinamide-GDP ribazoletransferase
MRDWLIDLRTATALLTRVPLPRADAAHPPNLPRAGRVFPLIGAAIGGIIGLIYTALLAVGLPALAAGALALAAGAWLTGATCEDGLADCADGFGGGRGRADKLEIMRDSRLGTFGAIALLAVLITKISALETMPDTAALPGLITAHALARCMMPTLALALPYARDDGHIASGGRPEPAVALTAMLLGLLVALLCLPIREALGAALVAAIAALAVGALAQRQIGGQTHQVLGAAQQVAETAVLLLLVARLV